MTPSSRLHILCYHGVHEDDLDLGERNSSGKHIPASIFEAHLQEIRRAAAVVSMDEVRSAFVHGATLPKVCVAVTFDDGFYNNWSVATPLLVRYEIPATLYVATGFIDSGEPIWTDRLESLIIEGRDPLVLGSRTHQRETADQRRLALYDVKRDLKSLAPEERDAWITSVEKRQGGGASGHSLYRFLTWSDLKAMQATGLWTLGGHTRDHVSLALVPREVAEHQVAASLSDLRSNLSLETRHFSYPEGQARDIPEDPTSLLGPFGVDICPTAMSGVNIPGETGPFELRRTMVGFEGSQLPALV